MDCVCVGKHVPLPQVLYQVAIGGSQIALCPTTHDNLNTLESLYRQHNGRPPGSVRKHFSEYVQNLAHASWKEENETSNA